MAGTTYGQKGGQGPNKGKKATAYLVTLPNGIKVKKRIFDQPTDPVGYAYQHGGKWHLATVSERNDEHLSHYTQCPAQIA